MVALTRVPEPKVECASPVCYADEFAFETQLFTGVCEGRIGFEPQGRDGFGYDPLFFPLGFVKSFAVLPRTDKHEERAERIGQKTFAPRRMPITALSTKLRAT